MVSSRIIFLSLRKSKDNFMIWHLKPRANWNRKNKKGFLDKIAKKNLFQLRNFKADLNIEKIKREKKLK